MEQSASGTRCCWELPARTLTEQGAAAHVSTLLDVVTTLTNRRAAKCIAAGRCRGSWSPQKDIQGCASKNPHGTRGCRAHVQASGCGNNPDRSKGCQTRCCWEVSRLVEGSGICRDVPAKTLTEQGAAAHRSKLLDVVTTRCCWEVSTPEGPKDIQGCDSKHKGLPHTCPRFWML